MKFFVVDTQSTVNVIMGREWIYSVKGVVLTFHQLQRCQSPNRMYMIDIKGDLTRDHQCFNLDSRGKVNRLSEEKLRCVEKGKAEVGEEISKDANQ